MKKFIEVGVSEKAATNEKGEILEDFCKRFLETQGFEVAKRLRVTGAEVDLLAKERATGEQILVECKAYNQNIPAETISKIVGNVSINDYSSGWLICTSPLTKDAAGIKEQWVTKPEESRRKLRIYDPDELLKRLIASTVIIDPQRICDRHDIAAGQAYLLITAEGEFWVFGLSDEDAGVLRRAIAFFANDGRRIESQELLKKLSQTESSLKSLDWSQHNTARSDETSLADQAANIVRVSSGDAWTDYRPSRPEDYIGREQLQDNVFAFLDAVRTRTSRTRLFALRAPSGWGKSSTLLKLEAKARNVRKRQVFRSFRGLQGCVVGSVPGACNGRIH